MMTLHKSLLRSVPLSLGVAWCLLASGHPLPALAQPDGSEMRIAQFSPPPPPSQGRPSGNQRGGASRGACSAEEPRLTALVPEVNDPAGTFVWGLTTQARPTFWFYVPYALSADLPAEFVLLNDQNQPVYQTVLSNLNTQPGIIQVSLPETAEPLAVDQTYQWVFMLGCDVPIFTRGSIQRVAPSPTLESQLAQASSPKQKADLYAANGIWFDALTTLADLRQAQPGDSTVATDWANLMQSVGLADIADKPLVPCCTAASTPH
jgi:hypothetical protein